MNCDDIKEILYDYTKNEVSVKEISEIETHLEECSSCASELAHIKGISSIIKASIEEPHESVFLNISRNIKPAFRKTINWLKPALAAALVMLVAVGVYFYAIPEKTELAEVPKAIAESYAVVESNYLEETESENTDTYNDGSYAPASNYTGGYTPVSYIIGQ